MRKALIFDSTLCFDSFTNTNVAKTASIAIKWQYKMQRESDTPQKLLDVPLPELYSAYNLLSPSKSKADSILRARLVKETLVAHSTCELRRKLRKSKTRLESLLFRRKYL